MSQPTPHTYRNKRGTFKVAFDELEPADTITMRQATFEKLANVKISDATVAVRGEPGAIPRAGRAVAALEPKTSVIEMAGPFGPLDPDGGLLPPKIETPPDAASWDSWTPDAKDAYLKEHPGTVINDPVANPDGTPQNPPIENQPPVDHEANASLEEKQHE